MDSQPEIDQKEITSLLKKLSEAIKIIEHGGNASPYVIWAKDWFNKNAPEYLE